eukprot:4182669-Prymnesium_polylepis.1
MERELGTCAADVVGQDQGVHQYLIHVRPPNGVEFELLHGYSSQVATLSHLLEMMRLRAGVRLNEPADFVRTRLAEAINEPDALVACTERQGVRRMCYDDLGILYNADGIPPAVVHQYNRFTELEQRIMGRLVPAHSSPPQPPAPLPLPSSRPADGALSRGAPPTDGGAGRTNVSPGPAKRPEEEARSATRAELRAEVHAELKAELQADLQGMRTAFEVRMGEMTSLLLQMQERLAAVEEANTVGRAGRVACDAA